MSEPMTASLCKHSFPVQPPLGSLFRPGPCTDCGLTWDASQAEHDRQNQQVRLATAHDGLCEYCKQPAVVSQFQREAMPWDEAEPPVRWLCPGCWLAAGEVADGLTYSEISAALDDPQGAALVRFVFGGVA